MSKANTTTYKNDYVSCDVEFLATGDIRIVGKVASPSSFTSMRLFAPCPIDRMTSYSGSGLPFPCAAVAYENSPNNHVISTGGDFDAQFKYPNGYYMSDAKQKIPPSIFFSLSPSNDQPVIVQFKLPDPLPLRTLGYRPMRQGPLYYSAKESLVPIASAEDTMIYYADAKARYDIA